MKFEQSIKQAQTLIELEDLADFVDFQTPEMTVDREQKLRVMIHAKMNELLGRPDAA